MIKIIITLLCTFILAFNPQVKAETKSSSSGYLWVAALDAGIYAAKFNQDTGKLTDIKQVEDKHNGYFIAKHPEFNIVYLAERLQASSRIHTYRIIQDGHLQHLSSLDGLPEGIVHISVDNQGNNLAAAYYKSSYIGIYQLTQNGQQVSVRYQNQHIGASVHSRQKAPHPHWSGFSPNGHFAYFADLGSDHIWVYQINPHNNTVNLVQKAPAPAGSGPRHIAFNQAFDLAYVSDELRARVSLYKVSQNGGKLSYLTSTKPLPELQHEAWFNVSDIKLHPTGQFLYLVNRGFDQVSVFNVNSSNGTLDFVEHEPVRGSISRHINFDSSGKWALVLAKESSTVAIFKVNVQTGALTFNKPVYSIPTPMAVVY
ncbi:6-phosphogluconolactonase [Catenovulum agarivorans DS-2]|uniref:6-phosphogluconolactonase n=1 Tax=Catenovulum agarivorans DS-2 TaxID=1328313 RepID=W7QHI4_9ALTE|nr:beta-propeller fold lactonase family protein [Catenovulum agarivorans]EWH08412.1 6-phosphogluconolactonase [Catenovulum agarivorans DS-2]